MHINENVKTIYIQHLVVNIVGVAASVFIKCVFLDVARNVMWEVTFDMLT
jgi:hypothetical protein